MRDILLQISGVVAIAAALIHGVLSETKIFPRVTIEPQRLRTLFRFVLDMAEDEAANLEIPQDRVLKLEGQSLEWL